MIRRLTEEDAELLKAFAYEREREHLFVIGSFKSYENTLKDNWFWGYFEGDEMKGLGSLFSRWGSFVVNAQDNRVIEALTDQAVMCERRIEYVPYFRRYAEVVIERLQTHGIGAKHISDEVVLTLSREAFVDFSTEEESLLQAADRDEYIRLHRLDDGENPDAPIQEAEKKRVQMDQTFVLKVDGKLVSTANPHGVSKHYFQIGGVLTREGHRGRGYAKRVVSKLCRHFFDEGVQNALLFVDKKNMAALKVYESLGFTPEEDFLIAKY